MRNTQAILIRLTRLTDSSLIVHWFSEDYGLVKTVARGARRPKSPFAGQLDLFYGGEMSFRPARRGDLHHLCEVRIRDWRDGLRGSYLAVLMAAYWCQLVEAAVEIEHPEPGLHGLLERALSHLGCSPPSLRALTHFERELARLLGVKHPEQSAERSLREAMGALPPTRAELLERLAGSSAFRSS